MIMPHMTKRIQADHALTKNSSGMVGWEGKDLPYYRARCMHGHLGRGSGNGIRLSPLRGGLQGYKLKVILDLLLL